MTTTHKRSAWLALGTVAGPILFTLGWFVLGFISPGYTMWSTRIAPYSIISQPLSGLGLGPTGALMNATFIASGFLINGWLDRKSTRLNSSHQIISYAVFCLKKKK